jgi:flagellar hook protein FlgE
MLRSLNSGVSGLQQFQGRMDVIGNNIANVNTVGFKSGRVDFAETFSQMVQAGGAAGSQQIGMGVTTNAITNQFTQGTLASTGRDTDLAINGDDFFTVRDANSGAEFLTRAGNFHLDTSGRLITSDGLRVQGFADAGLTARGDLQIDGTGSSAAAGATMKSFSIGEDGKITVRMSDGTEFVRGQVLLQSVSAPQMLVKEGNNLYSNIAAAGPLAATAAPGSAGMGTIARQTLELSNVDLSTEFTSLITNQRAFQANARIIVTSDEVLQELVNLKR